MNIYPACSIKTLLECKPNQLVRVIGHNGFAGMFCLVAHMIDKSDQRALIVLGDGQPAFHVVENPESCPVLAFDEKPTLALDPIGSFEARAQHIYNAIGCVSRHKKRWLMRVQSYHGYRHQQASFDLESGRLIEHTEELQNVAFFGKWRITMPAADKLSPPIEVTSFEWKEPQTG
ncbi:hypothetical protein [Breoghania sp.]|uniref:hypothetical protein n=1 Tax=Breoghania sp. TaxID=2065378 RepID=UPI002AA882E2|nr:hypothetical protein [Breoghania sp.]